MIFLTPCTIRKGVQKDMKVPIVKTQLNFLKTVVKELFWTNCTILRFTERFKGSYYKNLAR